MSISYKTGAYEFEGQFQTKAYVTTAVRDVRSRISS
jgi:hypothetical protein